MLLLEGADKLGGLRDPAELVLDGGQGGLVADVGHAGLSRAIGQQETDVIAEHRVAEGGFDANARGASREDQTLDGTPPEDVVEIRFIESAVTLLVKNNVAGLGRQLRHDLRVPGIADENPAALPVRGGYSVAQAQAAMLDPVRSIEVPSIREVRPVAHLKVDDAYAGLPRRGQNAGRGRNGATDGRDIDAGLVEHPAGGTEVILHVDDNNGALHEIDSQRFGLRIDDNLSVSRHRTSLKTSHGV